MMPQLLTLVFFFCGCCTTLHLLTNVSLKKSNQLQNLFFYSIFHLSKQKAMCFHIYIHKTSTLQSFLSKLFITCEILLPPTTSCTKYAGTRPRCPFFWKWELYDHHILIQYANILLNKWHGLIKGFLLVCIWAFAWKWHQNTVILVFTMNWNYWQHTWKIIKIWFLLLVEMHVNQNLTPNKFQGK